MTIKRFHVLLLGVILVGIGFPVHPPIDYPFLIGGGFLIGLYLSMCSNGTESLRLPPAP